MQSVPHFSTEDDDEQFRRLVGQLHFWARFSLALMALLIITLGIAAHFALSPVPCG